MKKTISLLLVMCMLVTVLAGCASNENTPGGEPQASAPASGASTAIVKDESREYHMFVQFAGYSFWQECWRGFKDAADVMGVTAVYSGIPEYELNTVLTSFNQLVAQKPNGIALTCMDADAYVDPINNALEAGVDIVVFDSDSPNSNRPAFIGTENYNCGVTAAQYIGDAMGGKGSVGVITVLTQSNIVQRNLGFGDTMDEKYPDMKYEIISGGKDETETAEVVKSFLQVNPDIDYLFATTFGMCTGTLTALQEMGLDDKVKVITFDTDEATLDNIDNGIVEATISQSPYCMGWWSLMYLYFMDHEELVSASENWKENGYPFLPQISDSGSVVVTKDNTFMFRKGSEG